jgi:hypothetical protein
MFNDLGIQATSRKMQDFTQSSKTEKAIFCKSICTLVVPKWKSALFWPCIALEHKFKWFVKDVIPKRFFSEGSHKESVFAR